MKIKIFEDFNESKEELIHIINDAFSIIEDDDRFGPNPIDIYHDEEMPNIYVYIRPPTVTIGNGLDRYLNKAKSEYEILAKTKVAISLVESMCKNEIDVSFEYDDGGEDAYILLTFLEIEESGTFWVKRKGQTKLDLQKLKEYIKTPITYISTSSSGTQQHYLDIHFKDKQSIEDHGNELIDEISKIKIDGIALTQPFSEYYPSRGLVDFVKYVDQDTYPNRTPKRSYIRFCINNELNIIW